MSGHDSTVHERVSESDTASQRRRRGGRRHKKAGEATPTQSSATSPTTTISSSRSLDTRKSAGKSKSPSPLAQLRDIFPNWTAEDLQCALTESYGDVELAIQRITNGHVSTWQKTGAPVRKPQQPQSRSHAVHPDRSRRPKKHEKQQVVQNATRVVDNMAESVACNGPSDVASLCAAPASETERPSDDSSVNTAPPVQNIDAADALVSDVHDSETKLSQLSIDVAIDSNPLPVRPIVEMPQSLTSKLAPQPVAAPVNPVVIMPTRTSVNPDLCVPLCVSQTDSNSMASSESTGSVTQATFAPNATASSVRYTSTGVEAFMSSPRRNVESEIADIAATIRRPNNAAVGSPAPSSAKRLESVSVHTPGTPPGIVSQTMSASRRPDYHSALGGPQHGMQHVVYGGIASDLQQDASLEQSISQPADIQAASQHYYSSEQQAYQASNAYPRNAYPMAHAHQQSYYRGEGHMRYNGSQNQYGQWSGYGAAGAPYPPQYVPQPHQAYDPYSNPSQVRYASGSYNTQQQHASYYGADHHRYSSHKPQRNISSAPAHTRREPPQPPAVFSNAFAAATSPAPSKAT